jgi:malate synthase
MTAPNWNPGSIVRKGVVIRGAMRPSYEKVLTPGAIDFAVELEREFGAERRRLLARRAEIQRRLDAGWKPDFLPETQAIRESDWRRYRAISRTAVSRSPARRIARW